MPKLEQQPQGEEQQLGGEEQTAEQKQELERQADLEAEAAADGWAPKDQFKGDPADWVDAATFVKRGKEINPILRKNNERLMRELNKAKAEIAELRLTTKEFGEMYRDMSKNAYERAIKDLKAQERAARKEDDHELADDLAEQREKLTEESKNIKVPGASADAGKATRQAEIAAIVDEWQSDNPWYDKAKSPDLFYLAEGIALDFAKTERGKALVGKREFLDHVTEQVKKTVPDRFKNPRRTTGSPVSSSSSSRSEPSSNGKKSYADLPPEAKAACDRQTKSIPGFTREKYVQHYFEQQGV